MPTKFLAGFSDPIDLFYGQTGATDAGLIRASLAGPDFDVLIQEQDFDTASSVVTLKKELTHIVLSPIEALGKTAASCAAPLRVMRAGEDYVIKGLNDLSCELEALNISNILNIERNAARLTLGLDPWRLTVGDDAGPPIGQITLPLGPGLKFQLLRVVIDASGIVECRARLEAVQAEIGGLHMDITDGQLVMRGGKIDARLKCNMTMPYFSAARVDLELSIGGNLSDKKWAIAAATRIANNEPWRDPSGLLSFDRMVVAVDFEHPSEGSWNAVIRIGGRITFAKSIVPDNAGRWFEGLFDDMAVSFENVTLGANSLPGFAFSPANALRLKAMGLFDLKVPTLRFDQYSVTLQGGMVRLDAGGAVLAGTVGDIRINLVNGPSLDTKAPTELGIELATPGGFKAQAHLIDISTDLRQTLQGDGTLSSPALAPFEVSFTIGRKRDTPDQAWRPIISIMVAREDVNIPLFPGVVITRIELGAGINRTIRDVTQLTLAQAQQRLQQGLPDVMRAESWSDEAAADLTVVARMFTEPSQTSGDQAMSLYVGDVSVVMTSDFQFAAFGRLWLHTKRSDARSPDFQRQPTAVGLAMFDGLAPSLRIVAMTRPDGLSSLAKSIPAGPLLGMQIPKTQLAFEATPSGMALILGPLEASMELGPLRVSGSTLFALRSAGGKVYALSRSALSATFGASTGSVQVGPASLSGSVSVGFSATLLLLGDLRDSKLTVYGAAHASCWVDLALHVRIGFEISISVGFGSITISWYEDWDFSFRLHVDLDLQVGLNTEGRVGVDGQASLSINACGFSATLSLHIAAEPGLVEEGKKFYLEASNKINELLGAA